jgi:hypothetical protein
LEYCVADYSIASLAEALGKKSDSETFLERSGFYKNDFDTQTGFLRPRYVDGRWTEPFDPTPMIPEWRSRPGFVEGCAWHYAFFVPFDIQGLVELHRGESKFVKKLNECFEEKYYNMENEPDIAFPMQAKHSLRSFGVRMAKLPQRLVKLPLRIAELPLRTTNLPQRLTNLSQRLANLPQGLANLPQRLAKLPLRIAKN